MRYNKKTNEPKKTIREYLKKRNAFEKSVDTRFYDSFVDFWTDGFYRPEQFIVIAGTLAIIGLCLYFFKVESVQTIETCKCICK